MVERRRGLLAPLALVVLVLVFAPSAGLAHGELRGTDPSAGATVAAAPASVSVTLTERPTRDAVLVVRDGCRRSVGEAPTIDGHDVSVAIAPMAEPGVWSARYEAVSAEDGHFTKGGFRFRVRGRRDCSKPGPTSSPGPGSARGPGASPPDDDGGSLPVVPIGLAAVAITGVALAVRKAGARS